MNSNIVFVICLHSQNIARLVESQERRVETGRARGQLENSWTAVSQSVLIAIRLTDDVSDVLEYLRFLNLLHFVHHVIYDEWIHDTCKARIDHLNLKDVLIEDCLHVAL